MSAPAKDRFMTTATITKPKSVEQRARESFAEGTTEHVMTIVKDDGLYRRLRFAKPGSFQFYFEVITWPGYIALTGDMRSLMMTRVEDMIGFVASPGSDEIDFRYWAQKVVASAGNIKQWCCSVMIEQLHEAWVDHCLEEGVCQDSDDGRAAWAEIQDDIIDTSAAYGEHDERTYAEAISNFTGAVSLLDAWEWDCRDLEFDIYWQMLALRYAANAYLAAKVSPPVESTLVTKES